MTGIKTTWEKAQVREDGTVLVEKLGGDDFYYEDVDTAKAAHSQFKNSDPRKEILGQALESYENDSPA